MHQLDLYQQVSIKTKWNVNKKDIENFIKLINDGETIKFINNNITSKNDIIYMAEFNNVNSNISANISAFRTEFFPAEQNVVNQYPDLEIINVVKDWFYYSKVWFRYNRAINAYESMTSYIDEQRDTFSVNLSKPLALFNVKIS